MEHNLDGETFLEGKRQAQIALYKETYMKYYRNQPSLLPHYEELLMIVDNQEYEKLRCLALITINFPVEYKLDIHTCNIIEEVLNTRSWIKKVYQLTRENMTKDGDTTHPHVHIAIELRCLYSPAQIAQMLARVRYIQDLNVKQQFINVQKYPKSELLNVVRYCQKDCWVEPEIDLDLKTKHKKGKSKSKHSKTE